MYDKIIENLEKQLSRREIAKIKEKKIHLGIFTEPCLTYMMEAKKTIESRFSKNKIAPYRQITKDDIVIVKKSGGKIVGYFTIKDVVFFDLSITPIAEIKAKYDKQLCVTESFWHLKKASNYATLIMIDNLVKLEPFAIDKKGMQTWIKLN